MRKGTLRIITSDNKTVSYTKVTEYDFRIQYTPNGINVYVEVGYPESFFNVKNVIHYNQVI